MMKPSEQSQHQAAPCIATLMSRYLATRQQSADSLESQLSEVEPHDAATGFRAALTTTWADSTTLFRLLGLKAERIATPPEWASFVASDETQLTPLAAGFPPQRLRQPTDLLVTTSKGLPRSTALAGLTSLRNWVRQSLKSRTAATLLVAAGIATALGDWTEAEQALAQAEPLCSEEWKSAWLAQLGAIRYRQGQFVAAKSAWCQIRHHGLKCFNLGLLVWQMGNAAEAVNLLEEAADQLPEHSGWSHLARLYATLASD